MTILDLLYGCWWWKLSQLSLIMHGVSSMWFSYWFLDFDPKLQDKVNGIMSENDLTYENAKDHLINNLIQ